MGGVNCGRTDKTVKNRDLSAGADGAVSGDGSVRAPADAPRRRVAVYGGGPDAVGGDGGEQGEYQHGFGIGPVLAQRIIDRRTERGPFTSVEELLEVDGIGQATLDGLREFITVKETKE